MAEAPEKPATDYASKQSIDELKEKFRKEEKTAFILGYTGNIGSLLLEKLLEENLFQQIVLIGRRKVDYEDPRYQALDQRVVDFDKLEDHGDAFAGCDVGYNCLGMPGYGAASFKKSLRDQKLKLDKEYPVKATRMAKEQGCQEFYLVSGYGVDAKSGNQFLRNRGEAEEEIRNCDFDKYIVYRPCFIAFDNRPRKWYEKSMELIFPNKYSIKATQLVRVMINSTVTPAPAEAPKWRVMENVELRSM